MTAHLATDPQLLHISSIIRSLLFRSRLVTLWTENLVPIQTTTQSLQPLWSFNQSNQMYVGSWVVGTPSM